MYIHIYIYTLFILISWFKGLHDVHIQHVPLILDHAIGVGPHPMASIPPTTPIIGI